MSRATRGSLEVGSVRMEGACGPQLLGHQGLMRLREWIAMNGALDLGSREAATIACLEPHYFSFVFHRHVGITFIEWRRRYRVAYALQAIANDLASIDEIARVAGYSSRRSLERAMKRVVGRTPRSTDCLAGLSVLTTASKNLNDVARNVIQAADLFPTTWKNVDKTSGSRNRR